MLELYSSLLSYLLYVVSVSYVQSSKYNQDLIVQRFLLIDAMGNSIQWRVGWRAMRDYAIMGGIACTLFVALG